MPEQAARKGAGVELALAVWSRRKWLAILTFAAPFAVAMSLGMALPDIYQATATVLVDRQQVPESFVRPTVTSALETRLHTISQEILSRSRLDALITRFGLYPDFRKRVSAEEVIERMRGEFKRRYLGELPQQMETNVATLERFHIQLRLNSDNQTRVMERRAALASQQAEAGASGGGPEEPQTRLVRLKQQMGELRAQFSEKYPDVVVLRAEIAALEQQLDEAKAEGKPARPEPATPYARRLKEALSEIDAETRILKGEEKHLRASIAAYQARVDNVPRREQEFKEFSRDYESTRELYQSLLKRYGEAQIAESMEQRQKGEQFRILDPAVPAREPVARRVRFILMRVMLSLV